MSVAKLECFDLEDADSCTGDTRVLGIFRCMGEILTSSWDVLPCDDTDDFGPESLKVASSDSESDKDNTLFFCQSGLGRPLSALDILEVLV